MRAACWLLLAGCACVGGSTVEVLRLPMQFEQQYTIQLNNTIEYILEFTPVGVQAQLPSRVQLQLSAGDVAWPALITARQLTGAQTWQLPYTLDEHSPILYNLQRTLCFNLTAPEERMFIAQVMAVYSSSSYFEQDQKLASAFSLHVSSGSATPAQLSVLAEPAHDWPVRRDTPTTLTATTTAPRLLYYSWVDDDDARVLLTFTSEDDVCATLAVQDYTCPLPETSDSLIRSQRMTVQRSGGVQVARSQFPAGFVVALLVSLTDEECTGEETLREEPSWLWEAATGGSTAAGEGGARTTRDKTFTITVQPSITRGQYIAATLTTLALFLGFYVTFGALVVAQRYKPFKKYVAPKAVLAKAIEGETMTDNLAERRRRRGSNATFDSVDDDSEESAAEEPPPAADNAAYTADVGSSANPATNQVVFVIPAPTDGHTHQRDTAAQPAAPFGLPVSLRVSALSRRGARTLRARSDRYLHTLYIVAVFYALPVIQFVAAFQVVLNVTGSLDLCYYNFLCAHPLGVVSDFNHIYSNLGYLLLGALFILQVKRRRWRRDRKPRDDEYGIPAHYGLLEALGAGMMVVALLSAAYHVCPNGLNFQFDTSFMYVLAVLSMVKMYQSRHPDINARAHATFGVLAVLIALVVWGVLGGGAWFWGAFTVLHVFTFLLLSLRIYYVGQFRFEPGALAEATRGLRAEGVRRPLYTARLVMLLIANAVNWGFALYGLWTMAADFASHLLQVLLCNTLLYMVFYLAMKLLHGERPRWYAWLYLAGAAVAWAPALYFFTSGSTSWSRPPAASRHRNHLCYVLHFYDSHDLWHMLSAVALYLSFGAMLTWDDGLAAVKRSDIAVF